MFTHAIVRRPCENFSAGLRTTNRSQPADYELMLEQHQAYLQALSDAGLEVIVLDAQPDFPDAHFVEDTAVVTSDIAVITIPGAEARRGEEATIAPVLAEYRRIECITPPGTLDGGDVLQVGNHFFIGLSERTNLQGAEQLARILESRGHTWTKVRVGDGLHFKSSVNYVGQNSLIVNPEFSALDQLDAFNLILTDRTESYAANTLLVNDYLLMPTGYPKTRKQLIPLNLRIVELEVSEVRKMDGGLTCMSLRF